MSGNPNIFRKFKNFQEIKETGNPFCYSKWFPSNDENSLSCAWAEVELRILF